MANPVYSIAQASTGLLASGTTDLGGPPDGFVWVIRDMRMTNLDVGLVYKNGFRVYDSNLTSLWTIQEPFAMAGPTFEWHGHQVIEGDQTISVTTGETGWELRISGYQLTLP